MKRGDRSVMLVVCLSLVDLARLGRRIVNEAGWQRDATLTYRAVPQAARSPPTGRHEENGHQAPKTCPGRRHYTCSRCPAVVSGRYRVARLSIRPARR